MLPTLRTTRFRVNQYIRSRPFSTSKTPYTLTRDQSEDSPIDTTRVGDGLLQDVDPNDFQLWTCLLAPSEQAELLRASLSRLDAILGVSRACRAYRKQATLSVPTTARQDAIFLPENCYKFEAVSTSTVVNKYHAVNFFFSRAITTALSISTARP
jgi:hypothetical protein